MNVLLITYVSMVGALIHVMAVGAGAAHSGILPA